MTFNLNICDTNQLNHIYADINVKLLTIITRTVTCRWQSPATLCAQLVQRCKYDRLALFSVGRKICSKPSVIIANNYISWTVVADEIFEGEFVFHSLRLMVNFIFVNRLLRVICVWNTLVNLLIIRLICTSKKKINTSYFQR